MTEHSQAESWVNAAQEGNRLALAKLLTMCHPRMRARAEARMDAAMKARIGPEDILQEVYLHVARQIEQFENRGPGSFVGWIESIVDHKVIDARRALRCQARDIDREVPAEGAIADSYWGLFDHVYADSGTPSRVVRKQEALGALLAGLADLPESHRQVLRLRFLEGYSVNDTAKRMNKSEAAIVALTKRALVALRRAMDELGEFTHGA
jgi:RNA polymerase sigma-70 factor (ECF subfamily)